MTFDSLTFVVFLALTFAAYWATPSWTVRKVLVLVCSYVFYAAWNPFSVLLIIATTGFDWFAARWMNRTRILSRRKAIMAASAKRGPSSPPCSLHGRAPRWFRSMRAWSRSSLVL